jgi:hypothetical protein
MKEDLRIIVQGSPSAEAAWNRTREYLQARILGLMQQAGAMIPLAFCGGTSLRFLYGAPRFSEDLDFSMERPTGDFSLASCMDRVLRGFIREGYDATLRGRELSPVSSFLLRFPGLPFEMGMSPRKTQVLSIKVDVDTHPPAGAGLEITIVRKFMALRLQHHDRPSLLAGKLHAVLTRGYPKGRDYYDLLWYMTSPEWPTPNMLMLENALRQTGWPEERIRSLDAGELLSTRFRSLDWEAVRRDVLPFLGRPEEADLLNEQDMLRITGSFLERTRAPRENMKEPR